MCVCVCARARVCVCVARNRRRRVCARKQGIHGNLQALSDFRFSFKQGDQIAILGDAEDAVMHNAMNGARRCAPLEVLAALGAQV